MSARANAKAQACCPPEPRRRPRTPAQAAELLAAMAKALGHPARVRIVRILLAKDACICGEIVEQVPLAQSTVSQHLKILRDAGLIRGEIDGPHTCYCVNHLALAQFRDLLAAL